MISFRSKLNWPALLACTLPLAGQCGFDWQSGFFPPGFDDTVNASCIYDSGTGPNLYVAGSSLFPTSGWANPTLTIVALALRAADDIDSSLGR